MAFPKMDAASYRALTADELDARKQAIVAELTDPASDVPTADLIAERDLCVAEVERRNMAADLADIKVRNANAAAVAAGKGTPITGAQALSTEATSSVRVVRDADPFDTDEYHRAFFDYVMRGNVQRGIIMPGQRPANVREDAFTVTSDVPNFIPTTLSTTILEKMESYGDLWPMLTKISVRGGYNFNVWEFEPEASWVTETAPSSTLAVPDASEQVSFSYYMLECRVAQSQLASLTTYDAFQRKFPEVVSKAMVKALEQAYINGTGSGQMLGLLNDDRISDDNKVALTDTTLTTWDGWHKYVKAKMKKSYRDGIFIMAQGTFDAYIDGMVDTNGQPVARVNYGINGEELYRFMGKEVMIVEDDLLPSYDDADDGDAFALFTKPSEYYVNQQMGMRVVNWTDEDLNVLKHKAQIVVDGKLLRPWGTLLIYKNSVPTSTSDSTDNG